MKKLCSPGVVGPQSHETERGVRGATPNKVLKKALVIVLSLSVIFSLFAINASAKVVSTVPSGGNVNFYKLLTPFDYSMKISYNSNIPSQPNAFNVFNVVDGVFSVGYIDATGNDQYLDTFGSNFGSFNYKLSEYQGDPVVYMSLVTGTAFDNINFGSYTDQGRFEIMFNDFGNSLDSNVYYGGNAITFSPSYCSSVTLYKTKVVINDLGIMSIIESSEVVELGVYHPVAAVADRDTPYVLYTDYRYVIDFKNGPGGNFGNPFTIRSMCYPVVNVSDTDGYDASNFIDDIGEFELNIDNLNIGGFLANGVGGFLQTPLIGPISIGDILLCVVGITLVVAFLKFFAGG